jgi:uncharacterized membrane protein YfcA
MKEKKGWLGVVLGAAAGFLNGLFGAGGGVAVVPMLEQMKIEPQKAHATSVAIIFPLSVLSTILYWFQGVPIDWNKLVWLLPFGIVGAVLGSKWLTKIPQDLLRRIFGAFVVYSGFRMLFF